jgi:hypothetical protein
MSEKEVRFLFGSGVFAGLYMGIVATIYLFNLFEKGFGPHGIGFVDIFKIIFFGGIPVVVGFRLAILSILWFRKYMELAKPDNDQGMC